MKNMKESNNKNILMKILLGLFSGFICVNLIKLLIPVMYSIFMNLLGISINLLTGLLIGGSILGIAGIVGLVTKCISVKTEYEYDNGIVMNPDIMRQQLRIVESKDNTSIRENVSNKKYSYMFDNNYMDVEDIEIDDVMNPNWRDEFGFGEVKDDIDDSDVKIYTRKK